MDIFNINQKIIDQFKDNLTLKEIRYNDNRDVIGYDFLYQYENNQIELNYNLINGSWNILSNHFDKNQQNLESLLKNLQLDTNISFKEQIEILIENFNKYFYELKCFLNEKIESSQFDQQINDLPSQSLTDHFQEKLNHLIPTTIHHRIRQESASSSTNSIRYAQFLPPCPTISIHGRRVIHSILLNVQRKKPLFENFVNALKQIPNEPTMYELGLEFLRLYDGKFNYPQGHTFVMLFHKRTWFLTIVNIQYIECYSGDREPQSILILKYKNKFTNVHI